MSKLDVSNVFIYLSFADFNNADAMKRLQLKSVRLKIICLDIRGLFLTVVY